MRIISQDGTTDFQYEKFAIAITKDNKIVACKDLKEKPYEILASVIASYSTKEKAQKAMDMLHDSYVGCIWKETHYDYSAKQQVSYLVMNNVVFQFPLDKDLEV